MTMTNNRMMRRRWVLPTVLSLLLLTGCGAKEEPAAPAAPPVEEFAAAETPVTQEPAPQVPVDAETITVVPEAPAEPKPEGQTPVMVVPLEPQMGDPMPDMDAVPEVVEPVTVDVETAYMVFRCPEDWQDTMKTSQTTDGAVSTTAFLTEAEGREVTLFTIVLTPETADGYLLGRLTDDTAGVIQVYSVMAELNEADWSAETYLQLCSMQERVNEIIIQLYGDARFTPAG